MEYTFETVYDQKAVSAMVRTLRKTLRKKRSWRTHIWGWIVLILAFFLAWPVEDGVVVIGFRNIVTWLAIAETADFFVFLFDMNHGQVYAKSSLTGGTVDQFRDFIETRTGMPVEFVK